MNYSYRRAIFWLSLFFGLALVPLGIGRLGQVPEGRGFFVEFGVALGFLALATFALQFLFSGRLKRVAPLWGMDNIIQFHREIGLVALGLVLAHPIVLIAADSTYLQFFDPRVNFLRAVFLSCALAGSVLIVATSVWRVTFRLSYEWWRLLHGGLAISIVLIGIVHTFQVGHFVGPLWKKVALALLIGAAVYPLVHTRIVRPWRNRKRPYRIVDVKAERDSSTTLSLEPVGHRGIQYAPGQFAWITINDSPFTLQQHPFSFSSSIRSRQICFTAKEFGDFTERWKEMEAGITAFLEGPFGSFVPHPSPDVGLFLVMGGIGVTPAMSIIRTLRDDGADREVILIYGNKDWENVTFREELERLQGEMNLKVIHLLEDPPDDWEGETGFVTKELIQKHLPEEPLGYQYFVCGPDPLMDVTEISLRELGIPWQRIYSERFQIV